MKNECNHSFVIYEFLLLSLYFIGTYLGIKSKHMYLMSIYLDIYDNLEVIFIVYNV